MSPPVGEELIQPPDQTGITLRVESWGRLLSRLMVFRIYRKIVGRSNPISLIPHNPKPPVLSEDLQVGSIHHGVESVFKQIVQPGGIVAAHPIQRSRTQTQT